MKLTYFLFGALVLALASCKEGEKKEAETKTASSSAIATQADSVSYAIGVSIGQNLKRDKMTDVNPDLISTGIKSVYNSDSSIMNGAKAQACIQNYYQAKEKMKGSENLEKGKMFLAENGKKDGVKTLPSGLQYTIIKDGTGSKPKLTDKITAHYHGTTIDGNVFDSSIQRGQPAQFGVNQVIPGWTEALQLMSVGSKWKLFIPSNLAYGEIGNRGIEPNSVLIFDVELISIDK